MTGSEDMPLVELLAQCKASGDFQAITEAIPYARFMGFALEERQGDLLGRLPFSDHVVGHPGLPAVHGGALGALLELTAVFTLLWKQETVVLPKTINLTVCYLRSAGPQDTFARCFVTHHGRRVVHVRSEAFQEDPDTPVAVGQAHFLLP